MERKAKVRARSGERRDVIGGVVAVGLGLSLAMCSSNDAAELPASTAGALDDGENGAPAQWWMYTAQTVNEVAATCAQKHARIVDIKVDPLSPYPFTATYVENSGAYAKSWWWYYDIDGETLATNLRTNNARLTSFQAYDVGGGQIRYTAVMIANTGPDAKAWWYYPNLTAAEVGQQAVAHNARVTSIRSYVLNGQTYYAVVYIQNTGADGKAWWWYTDTPAA